MAHGLDHFFTGVNTVINGRYADTVTSQLLQMGGVSPQTANTMDSIIGMGGSVGAAKCAINAASSTFLQTIKSAGQPAVQEVKCGMNAGVKDIIKYAESPIGHQGWELKNIYCQPIRNQYTLIKGRQYSGHALNQMQN